MLRIDYESLLIGLVLVVFLSGSQQASALPGLDIVLGPAELNWIGDQVFRNECAGREACLVHWNEGEAFPSLGIGHFIWYPTAVDGPFVESFPAMIDYLTRQGVELPDWLAGLVPFDAPWADREAFLQATDTRRLAELRQLLSSTKDHQAGFLVQRAAKGLDRVVNAAPSSERSRLSDTIEALTSTPGGMYAVIDYVSFKGEGLADSERYNGQGWGLLQVFQAMDINGGETLLQAFRDSAALILTRRAENAGKPIEKERWLPGWLNRLDTYREPDQP
ncbi:hypothetical protein QPM17_02325 [Marinobacter sp. TBZ242]|uniref:Uncharacterized protein n=1 Tax=Marinobacter azerbaijanicus TaxID=3050455 RepID=A0ABT7I8D0_9GAMM|nr:hypothetical protein [Marinobacter sp. TBZ242]MDL0429945.1 hypothetical protein [Marinobacter sp. TBZ242]